MTNQPNQPARSPIEEMQGTAFPGVLMIFITILAAVLLALIVLPMWMPALSASLMGDEPKFYWYLSRGTAIAAYGILWMSMVFGLLLTNKLAQAWPGAASAMDLHQFVSLLGLSFALFHALILMGDRYLSFTLAQVLIPFNSQNYKPVWVGIGQLGFYMWALVAFSFYVRKRIGVKTWRSIHYVSFFSFLMALGHGIASGTDSGSLGMRIMYWTSGAILVFLLVYRILFSRAQAAERAQRLKDRQTGTASGRPAAAAAQRSPAVTTASPARAAAQPSNRPAQAEDAAPSPAVVQASHRTPPTATPAPVQALPQRIHRLETGAIAAPSPERVRVSAASNIPTTPIRKRIS